MNIAPGLRSANGAAPPRRSAKGRVAVSAAHSAARIPGSTRATTLAGSHAALVRRKEAIASARSVECGVVWFPSASDAAEASEASEAVVWVATARVALFSQTVDPRVPVQEADVLRRRRRESRRARVFRERRLHR